MNITCTKCHERGEFGLAIVIPMSGCRMVTDPSVIFLDIATCHACLDSWVVKDYITDDMKEKLREDNKRNKRNKPDFGRAQLAKVATTDRNWRRAYSGQWLQKAKQNDS